MARVEWRARTHRTARLSLGGRHGPLGEVELQARDRGEEVRRAHDQDRQLRPVPVLAHRQERLERGDARRA